VNPIAVNPSVIDDANRSFWNELCGSNLAHALGIRDDSPESLAKFDAYYFDLYPYLARYLKLETMRGKDVLEIGLGYGSVSQRIAAAGARYVGVDIAPRSVAMVQHRLRANGLPGEVRCANALDLPFADHSFNRVVAIGCLHHTGNLKRALQETARVLKPSGTATVMVYNAHSYRRWLYWPSKTWRHWRADTTGHVRAPGETSERERWAYDAKLDGTAAPSTAFVSAAELRRMVDGLFSAGEIRQENAGTELVLRFVPRRLLLSSLGHVAGLDLYCQLRR
jgi:SAM-dependent methyltransferase